MGDGADDGHLDSSRVRKVTPTKTPLFEAFHRDRYMRQEVIRDIQRSTGRTLICYVTGTNAEVNRTDTVAMVDLLHNVPRGADLDLLIHTAGGDIDSAEKITHLLWSRIGSEGTLRVIVPDFAKSAGTLIAIGADQIAMSDSSELGPIDAQVVIVDGNGERLEHSVQNYLDAYNKFSTALKRDPDNVEARIFLDKIDPARLAMFEGVKARSRELAERHLQRGMFRGGRPGNWTSIASSLLDTQQWLAHGQMINADDAENIGLTIDRHDADSDLWRLIWRLYCLQRLGLKHGETLYESEFASLTLED